ncbi:MAG: protein translocase subunit SecDF [Saprospiraceae bacterium]|nr:protein translocase subunit SecDF [Saprospiraceae bacterium]MCF8249622.1 protein translocase subunit SecDF [Saprospiraceae bacterium]MCF8280432.1 protein translocase subunit SecDF [Bacteroidales bacterium]MCF8310454.1 protein translocase subunit SecDF [Saprospiraceae bacterium]MCF8439832.1 protein translocase subunit SecDF [Saprospiraceae bacterium]
MQGKGFIKFFLVAFAVVSLIQFAFMIPTWGVESKADKYATSKCPDGKGTVCFRQQRASYLDSISSETIFRIPLLKSYTYQELKGSQLGFGLDLKGGMSVLLQVDLRDFIRAMTGNSLDKGVEDALKKATELQQNSQSDYISLFDQAWKETSGGRALNSVFKRNELLKNEINASSSDAQVIALLRREADLTVGRTYEMLKQRIDKLGVVGPTVSLDKGRDLILVELPGIENPQRARTFLQSAAKLEFWNVYRITDGAVGSAFAAANDKLKKMESGEVTTSTVTIDSSKVDSLGNKIMDTIEVAGSKVDTAGVDLTSTSGPLFDIFTPNNGSRGYAVMGQAERNKRDEVMAMLSKPGIKELFPSNVTFFWSRKPAKNDKGEQTKDIYELYAIKKEPGKNTAPLEGDHVTDAAASPNPTTGELAISLRMDPEGARIWGAMTQKAATDNNREIAIVLDSAVVSAPSVQNPILSGSSEITGSFTLEEANDIASILEVGKLPAGTKIIQESLVGPSLGKENINTSMSALLLGFLLVLAFMIFYYGSAGIFSIIVLFLNIIFLLGTVSSIGTVLTLPGIAGIVLTIGMAVDANVIIFERVREELREGKSLMVAIREGYRHSYSAIIDGNLTTLLTAIVLAVFGLGPIKGFAVILIWGIIFTFFTAVLVSRLLIEWWVGKGNNLSFWTSPTKNVLANLNVDWMGKRKLFYGVSTVITVLGIVSFFTRGFDLGVDFKGGFSYNVVFEKATEAEAIREALTAPFGKTPIVKAVDTENTYNILTDYRVKDDGDNVQEEVMEKLHEGLATLAGGVSLDDFKSPDGIKTHIISFSKVGPTVADDLRKSAWKAVFFGLLVIFLYILLRFNKWQYSLGAVIATSHDALIVVSLFSLLHGILPFPMEVDQAFIAAILTIIGYSVNDTVIVYDRIREYFGKYPDKEKHEIINMAINSTMSRTLITALTTLFTVMVLWIFGSGSIKGFAFALVIGVAVGTYSSVFIASPVMADLSKGDIRISSRPTGGGKEDKKSFTKAKSKA